MVLSSTSSTSVEHVAEAMRDTQRQDDLKLARGATGGVDVLPLWYQLYALKDQKATLSMVSNPSNPSNANNPDNPHVSGTTRRQSRYVV